MAVKPIVFNGREFSEVALFSLIKREGVSLKPGCKGGRWKSDNYYVVGSLAMHMTYF